MDALTGAYIAAPGLLSGVTTTAAKAGEILSLFGTSFGGTNPQILPGILPTGAAPVTASVSITLAGVPVPPENILYTGVAPGNAGLFQLNMIVPAGT